MAGTDSGVWHCRITCGCYVLFFFFQAEDGIRDIGVTGVQTCALPICGHRAAVLLEDRLELTEALDARVRTHVLVGGELYGLFLLLDLDGDDLAVEKLLFVGLGGPLVATHGVGVGLLAGYAVLLRDVLRRHAHVVVVEDVPQAIIDQVIVDVGLRHPHAVAVAGLVQQKRRPVHVLYAAGHHHISVAQRDLLRRRDYGLQARAAHPVQRHARRGHRQPSFHADLASGIHALPRAQDVADYDLVHLLAVDPRALQDLLTNQI